VEIDELSAETSSSFVEAALADGEVSAAEYKEAVDGLVGCLRDGGIEPVVEDVEGGTMMVGVPVGQASSTAYRGCEEKWDGGILGLYQDSQDNPENLPQLDLEAACLVYVGAAPEGFLGKDLENLLQEGGFKVSTRHDGTEVTTPPRNPDPKLPGGRSLLTGDEQVGACMRSPGLTMRTASPSPWRPG